MIDAIPKLVVGVAVAVTDPDPTAEVAAAKVVSVGAGLPRTVNVKLSNPALPVPSIVYSEPTTGIELRGVVVAVKVKVTMPFEMAYDVTVSGPVALLMAAWKTGGAPGPVCDSGKKPVPL